VTLAGLVALAEQILTLAALAGAVWSAYAFIHSLAEKRELVRSADVAKWLKVSVHQLLQGSSNFLTISEITNALRSSSYVTKLEINKEELGEAGVRLLLLEMLEAGTIAQLAADQYGIRHRDPASTLDELAVTKDQIVREAFAYANMAPGNFDTDSLRQQVCRAVEVSAHNFSFILSGMAREGILQLNQDGRWEPCYFPKQHTALPTKEADL
jgi:hypothetical protein